MLTFVLRCVLIPFYCLLFFRAGVRLGSVTEHIELAGCKGDCRSFLLLLLGGALSPSMSQITCREEGVHGLCGAVAKSLSKVCTLHRQYSTVLSRESRMSVFGTVWGTSKTCNVPSRDLYYQSAEAVTATPDRARREESPLAEGDAEVKSGSSCKRNVTLVGSTLDTSSCAPDPRGTAPSERDLGLSMELSVCIIKDLMSLILGVKAEMDSEHEAGRTGRSREIVEDDEIDGDEIVKQLWSRSSYRTGHAGRPPPAGRGRGTGTGAGRLQDHFMIPLESCPIGDTARLTELKDRTTVRIVRAIMARGTAATVLETVKILRSTFGHGSGNILIPLPLSQVRQTDTRGHKRTRTQKKAHTEVHICAQLM